MHVFASCPSRALPSGAGILPLGAAAAPPVTTIIIDLDEEYRQSLESVTFTDCNVDRLSFASARNRVMLCARSKTPLPSPHVSSSLILSMRAPAALVCLNSLYAA